MGMATTNVLDRVSARMGLLNGVTPQFETALDVDHGGVLCALPALLSVGLLNHTDNHFELPAGYYRLDSLFVLLSFMALCRLTSIESLRYVPPGEWGKLLGLDRIPEVRTLRAKLKALTADDQAIAWSAALCADWMEALPEQTATLYVDGHVRVYHGTQTKLPRHYVARARHGHAMRVVHHRQAFDRYRVDVALAQQVAWSQIEAGQRRGKRRAEGRPVGRAQKGQLRVTVSGELFLEEALFDGDLVGSGPQQAHGRAQRDGAQPARQRCTSEVALEGRGAVGDVGHEQLLAQLLQGLLNHFR